MNKLIAIVACFSLTLSLHANVLNDPGFETTALGSLPDGDDLGAWMSFGGMPVVDTTVRSGSQALLLGNYPQPNADGNLRQSYTLAGEPLTWIMSAWVYYDSTEGDNDPLADFFYFHLQTDAGNFNTTITAGDLTDQTWNFIAVTNEISASATWVKLYASKQWTASGKNGLFYFDDTSLAAIPEPAVLSLIALAAGMLLRRRS